MRDLKAFPKYISTWIGLPPPFLTVGAGEEILVFMSLTCLANIVSTLPRSCRAALPAKWYMTMTSPHYTSYLSSPLSPNNSNKDWGLPASSHQPQTWHLRPPQIQKTNLSSLQAWSQKWEKNKFLLALRSDLRPDTYKLIYQFSLYLCWGETEIARPAVIKQKVSFSGVC